MPKKILLVDDEPLLIKGLKFSLEQEGYDTDEAFDGESAMEKFESGAYDLVLLDVMLPKLSGIEVCQRIREQSQVPIIMLTAKGEDMDKILGLEFGADDYMTKPFNILEVKARIRSIFRRVSMTFPAAAEAAQKSEPPQEAHVLTSGALSINVLSRSAFLNGADVGLTAKEYDLLHLFMEHKGKVFTREELLETVWQYDYLGDFRTVDVHIRRLREKIEPDPAKPTYIMTKWGVGYYFTE